MTTRNRKQEIKYRKIQKKRTKTDDCAFCVVNSGSDEFVENGKYFKVITNKFNYSYWDEQDVEHQVMLVPKLHTSSISKLPTAAAAEFLEFIGKYEANGYNIYARSNNSVTKSIPHQHTHLIKTNGKRKKIIIYSRKPFVLFTK